MRNKKESAAKTKKEQSWKSETNWQFKEAKVPGVGIVVHRFNTAESKYCPWVCVAESAALKYKKCSGKGLFALHHFKRGQPIGIYCGELLTAEEQNDKKTNSEEDMYIVHLNAYNIFVDGSKPYQPVEEQKSKFGLREALFDTKTYPWPGAYVHMANDPWGMTKSVKTDDGKTRDEPVAVANVMVCENGYMVALCDIPPYTELLWDYGYKHEDFDSAMDCDDQVSSSSF